MSHGNKFFDRIENMRAIEPDSRIEYYYEKYNMCRFFRKNMKDKMKIYQFEKNEYLCTEGKELEQILFFVGGKAKLFRTLANGRNVMLSFYEPLSVIGDIEFVKSQVASCTMQALTDCVCLGFPIEVARKELSEDSRFLNFLCESLAHKLYVISMNSSMHMIYPLENRLAGYIIETLDSEENLKKGELRFEEQLVNVAELLGTSYRHLLRTLSELVAKGVLTKDQKGYRVSDPQKLKELSCDLYHNSTYSEKGFNSLK